jgi:hypothetical protein
VTARSRSPGRLAAGDGNADSAAPQDSRAPGDVAVGLRHRKRGGGWHPGPTGSQVGGGERLGGQNPKRAGRRSLHDLTTIRTGNEALKQARSAAWNAAAVRTAGGQGPGNRYRSGSGQRSERVLGALLRPCAAAGRCEVRDRFELARATARVERGSRLRARANARGPGRKPQESHRGGRAPRGDGQVQTRKTGQRPGRTSAGQRTGGLGRRRRKASGKVPIRSDWRKRTESDPTGWFRCARPSPNGAGNELTSHEELANPWTRRSLPSTDMLWRGRD